MKAILISICILFAGASIAAQTTNLQEALDQCAEKYGRRPCFSAMIRQAERSSAEQLSDGVAKREQFIDQMNEHAKGKIFGGGPKSEWLVIDYPEPQTIDDLVVYRRLVQDPDSEAGANFAGLKRLISPLGFKGAIASAASGHCLVMPFANLTSAHIEKCREINYSTLD